MPIYELDPSVKSPEESPASSWEDIFFRLKEVNATLKGFYDERDQSASGKLSDEHRAQEEALIAEKGELFIDLLLLRRRGLIPYRTPAFIIKDPAEILHPFSQNLFYVHLPVPEQPRKAITAKIKLPQLRKPGVIDRTPEALALIGNYSITPEGAEYFLERSIEEVKTVRDEEYVVRQQGKSAEEFRHYLNRLEAHLVIDRFIGTRIRNALPEGYDIGVGFLSAAKLPSNEGAHLIEVSVFTPQYLHTFTLLPPRAYKKNRPELREKLNRAIDAIGGYDYYDYREPKEQPR